MSLRSTLLTGSILAIVFGFPSPTSGQVTITSQDMFNQIGWYYRAHANKGEVVVSGRLGTTGGPQAWDFTSGPQDDVYRFDYVAVNDGGLGADFPKATFAERKTVESDGARAYAYLEQVPGLGRRVYGAYEPKMNPENPTLIFNPPIIDFPETISYGDSWSTSMKYDTEYVIMDVEPDPEDPDSGGTFSIPIRVTSTSLFNVDAFGVINLPGVGFGDCLRVNELLQTDIETDLDGDGALERVATQFNRTYYWLRPDHGIAAQITSTSQADRAPENNFPNASHFLRMFETNHPKGASRPASGISGLKITLNGDQALLNWNKNAALTSYRVEYTDDAGKADSWKALETTPNNFVIDRLAGTASVRFYRVVGLK